MRSQEIHFLQITVAGNEQFSSHKLSPLTVQREVSHGRDGQSDSSCHHRALPALPVPIQVTSDMSTLLTGLTEPPRPTILLRKSSSALMFYLIPSFLLSCDGVYSRASSPIS